MTLKVLRLALDLVSNSAWLCVVAVVATVFRRLLTRPTNWPSNCLTVLNIFYSFGGWQRFRFLLILHLLLNTQSINVVRQLATKHSNNVAITQQQHKHVAQIHTYICKNKKRTKFKSQPRSLRLSLKIIKNKIIIKSSKKKYVKKIYVYVDKSI